MSAYGLTHRGQRIAAYSNREAARLARTSVFGHLKGVKIVKIAAAKKNPTKAQKRPTKLQRLMASTKRGKQKRMAKALSAYMKARNPGTKYAGAKVMKNPGGSITIIPIKLRRAK
jgi:hypothetical protein